MNFLKKYMVIIAAAITLLAMFLPFAKVVCDNATAEMMLDALIEEMYDTGDPGDEDYNEDMAEVKSVFPYQFTGFSSIQGSTIFAIIMILCPIAMIALDFIPHIESKRKLLAIAIPTLGIASTVLNLIFCFNSLGNFVELVGDEIGVAPGMQIGFILVMVGFIATLVTALIKYHNVTLDKEGLEKVKSMAKNRDFN